MSSEYRRSAQCRPPVETQGRRVAYPRRRRAGIAARAAPGRLGQGPLCGAGITIAALRPGSPLRETLLSIYRKFDAMRLPSNDVYARTGSSSKRLESSVTPSQHPSHDEEHKGRRKAAPANVPLPRTLNWVEGLPSSVRPTALLRQYARIANVFAATWNDPKALSSYMSCLLRDDRGGRKGLPPDILRELLALREYHTTLTEHSSTWAVLRKRG